MDSIITLIQEIVIGYDKNGNELYDRAERELFCRVYGVNRTEFYQAAAVGLKPELIIRLSDSKDYHGEKLARFDGELYSIIRTVRDLASFRGGGDMALGEMELVLTRKIGDASEEYLTTKDNAALLTENSEFITVEV